MKSARVARREDRGRGRDRRGGSPARTRGRTCSGCGRGPTRSSSGRAPSVADDPALTVRDPRFADARPPLRVAVDSGGPAAARRPAVRRRGADPDRDDGAHRPSCASRSGGPPAPRSPCCDRDADDGVSLPALLALLGVARRPGRRWSRAARTSRGRSCATIWWTGWSLYVAPKLLGGAAAPGRAWTGGDSRRSPRRCRWRSSAIERIGPDLKVEAHVHRDR